MLHAHGAHAEAVARISWCISEQAIGVISGECGAGKTSPPAPPSQALTPSRHTVLYLGPPGVGLRGIYGLIITELGGTPRFHHEQDALGFLGQLVYHQDEPLADPVCVPLHFVCHLARRRGVKVVLAGEGADELFCGYPRYRQILDHERELRLLLRSPRLAAHGASPERPPCVASASTRSCWKGSKPDGRCRCICPWG